MNKLKKLLRKIGPGFITGAADDDPSGIATYSQTGAQFGVSQLWMAAATLPFMIAIQETCGRIGLVTGKGIAAVVKERFGARVLYGAVFLLVAANAVNIGADLGAMASAIQLVAGGNFAVWLFASAALILALEIFVSYRSYSRYLKYCALTLLAYVATAFVVKQDWVAVLRYTLVPSVDWSRDYLFNIVAFLGTTISPYLFFWQASEENEEEVADGKLASIGDGKPRVGKRDIGKMRFDTATGMAFSNLMTFFIIVTTAATLGRAGIANVATATEAAAALKPLAGNFASLLFAVGIIGTGFLAVPVLAGSASYAVAETVGWRSGLYRKLRDAHGFYGIITVATVLGLAVNFIGVPPFKMLYYAAAINGIITPPLLALIVAVAADRRVMGKWASGRWSKIFGWAAVAVIAAAALALLAYH